MENRLIRPSEPGDAVLIEQLHDEAFGPGRFARAAYRIQKQAAGAGFGLTA
jgi:predicted N-acetyltransferase YhbS